jgi:exo-beta-1,3-glucanase (GH17 family)/glycosyltransferase involved in cell wall biosynthesis
MRSVAVVVALVACLHVGVWALLQTQASSAPGFDGILNSVSYSPFTTGVHPDLEGSRPPEDRIRAELKAIAPYARAIRLYSSTGGVEQVPKIAAEFGLKVTLGIWLDKTDRRTDKDPRPEFDPDCKNRLERDMAGVLNVKCTSRNIREITSALDLLHKNRNVNAIMVGNETLFRRDLTADQLAEAIKRVKREVGGAVPVSTGEIYSELLGPDDEDADQPKPSNALNLFQRLSGDAAEPEDPQKRALAAEKLVSTVDFVAVHVLPYWGGIPAENAVDATVKIYTKLREKFKGKRIVIAEFGWPSSGYNRRAAVPGKFAQAAIMRGFVARAHALGIDYNLIEAYDQPWKTIEGSVGAYWGLFDNQTHQPKFAWAGPVTDADSWKTGAVAVAVGVLLSLPVLGIVGATAAQVLLLAAAAHAVGAWAATVFDYWVSHYFVAGAAFALGLGTALLVPLVLIALGRIEEIAGILFGRSPARLLPKSSGEAVGNYAPKVSIHIPAYREPPEMIKATLDAVARLAYPNFECIIVVNNTPEEAMWRPVAEHCQTLGERFRFINAPKLEGYKAGALRLALAHTAPDAGIIGIIDADYAVTPDWLADLVPAFADPEVGLVQAPQDHRDGSRSPLHHVMNGEYAGFFDIGMVQRNETNAIIVHGTMCLIRRIALEAAGGWSSDTICEDTDLGLTILELGWEAHYTNRRYGYGLLPDTFEAYKRQRDRWASGGFQIVKKHWRRFLPGASALSRDQKREFAFGWINWLGAETVGVLVAILNLIWVPVVAFAGIAVPDKVLTLPILATFALSVAHFIALYRRRVPIPPAQAAGAMVAAMAMQWTVARAVANGVIKDHLTFVRTAKGGASRKRVAFPAFEEAVLGGLLVLGGLVVFATNWERVREINLFGCVLLVQSLPFLAAAALAAFESCRLNDFAVLQGLEARFAEIMAQVVPIRRGAINRGTAAPE